MRIPTTAAAAAALLSALLPLANAANLTFIVPPHPALLPAGASVLPASTHATLHSAGPALSAPLRRDGSFVFTDVPAGSYLLSVHARDHAFENLRVDVDADEKARAWQTFRGNEWSNKGEKRGEAGRDEGKLVAEVRAVAKKEYYQERGGFNVMSFLKNPMILMGVFSLALIVGMPYLMDNSKCPLFLILVSGGMVADGRLLKLQWTRRLAPNSRRCRRRARSRRIRRTSCRTSIWRLSWPARRTISRNNSRKRAVGAVPSDGAKSTMDAPCLKDENGISYKSRGEKHWKETMKDS